MYIVGIDLSGPSNSSDTALTAFNATAGEYLTIQGSLLGADDSQILSFIHSLQPRRNIVIGIDAPLSYNIGGGDRPADKALREEIKLAGLKPGTVMTPTMTRMVYLTLRGISLARALILTDDKINVVEVHPAGAMALRMAPVEDVRSFKKCGKCRWNLLAWLEQQGLIGIADIKEPTDHYVAACASALAAWKWSQEKSAWLQPADPPFHPFDYAC